MNWVMKLEYTRHCTLPKQSIGSPFSQLHDS